MSSTFWAISIAVSLFLYFACVMEYYFDKKLEYKDVLLVMLVASVPLVNMLILTLALIDWYERMVRYVKKFD